MHRSARLARVLFALTIAAGAAQSQTAPDQAPAAPPVITATTRLVQVSVIAKEKGGEPAAAMKAEDFRVLAERVVGAPHTREARRFGLRSLFGRREPAGAN